MPWVKSFLRKAATEVSAGGAPFPRDRSGSIRRVASRDRGSAALAAPRATGADPPGSCRRRVSQPSVALRAPRRPRSAAQAGAPARVTPASRHLAGRLIGGQRVALLDGDANRGAAVCGTECAALDDLGLARELVVLDLVAEPPRVVAVLAMELPGIVVDAIAELDEQQQIVRAQIEPGVRPAEVEAARLTEIALDVLARVPRALVLGQLDLEHHGLGLADPPVQRVARRQSLVGVDHRRWTTRGLAQLEHRVGRPIAD